MTYSFNLDYENSNDAISDLIKEIENIINLNDSINNIVTNFKIIAALNYILPEEEIKTTIYNDFILKFKINDIDVFSDPTMDVNDDTILFRNDETIQDEMYIIDTHYFLK